MVSFTTLLRIYIKPQTHGCIRLKALAKCNHVFACNASKKNCTWPCIKYRNKGCKNVFHKNSRDVGMVQCISHLCPHGKTKWWKNYRHKEEYHCMGCCMEWSTFSTLATLHHPYMYIWQHFDATTTNASYNIYNKLHWHWLPKLLCIHCSPKFRAHTSWPRPQSLHLTAVTCTVQLPINSWVVYTQSKSGL